MISIPFHNYGQDPKRILIYPFPMSPIMVRMKIFRSVKITRVFVIKTLEGQ